MGINSINSWLQFFSADYLELSFTPLICVQCFNASLIVPELLIFNKLSCLITISASILNNNTVGLL